MKTDRRYLISLNPDGAPFLHGRYLDLEVRLCSLILEPSYVTKPRIVFHVLRTLMLRDKGIEVEHVQHHLWSDEDPDYLVRSLVLGLSAGEIRGRSEEDAAHACFWQGMVQKPGGLRALSTIDAEAARFWAKQGWDGAPCPNCNAVTSMNTTVHSSQKHRRCRRCGGEWSIGLKELLEKALAPVEGSHVQ